MVEDDTSAYNDCENVITGADPEKDMVENIDVGDNIDISDELKFELDISDDNISVGGTAERAVEDNVSEKGVEGVFIEGIVE